MIGDGEIFVGGSGILGGNDGINRVEDGFFSFAEETSGGVLNINDTVAQFILRPSVTGLAGGINVLERATQPMIGNLDAAFADIGHMAIGAGDTRPGMNTGCPHFKFGVLNLNHRRTRFGVGPIFEAIGIVMGLDVVNRKPLTPWEGQDLVVALEILFDMALGTDIRTHFLAGGFIQIDTARFHCITEGGTGDDQFHRVGVVAIAA